MAKNSKSSHAKALQVLTRLQKALLRRLADYVLENEATLRQAADGAEGYGFSLHQLDELFLSRLNLIERTMAELHKSPVEGANRYRSMVFSAAREDVEHEINSRLEKMPSARVLGVTVSPASASSRVTYQFNEMAPSGGEGGSDGVSAESVAGLLGSVPGSGPPAAPEDLAGDIHKGLPDDICNSPGGEDDDELLVTVLYYGPALAADA
jgi:hypothetical protein